MSLAFYSQHLSANSFPLSLYSYYLRDCESELLHIDRQRLGIQIHRHRNEAVRTDDVQHIWDRDSAAEDLAALWQTQRLQQQIKASSKVITTRQRLPRLSQSHRNSPTGWTARPSSGPWGPNGA